jgi:TRAP-type C4-dicarboxylate transport system permease small subunit
MSVDWSSAWPFLIVPLVGILAVVLFVLDVREKLRRPRDDGQRGFEVLKRDVNDRSEKS